MKVKGIIKKAVDKIILFLTIKHYFTGSVFGAQYIVDEIVLNE